MSPVTPAKLRAVSQFRKAICCGFLLPLVVCFSACSSRTHYEPTHYEPARPSAAPLHAQTEPRVMSLTEAPSIPDLAQGKTRPPTPEELEEALALEGERWLYGPGFGRTMLNIGTVVIFPPYALYLVGNAGLSLLGYEPVYVTDALPEQPRKEVLNVYNSVTAVPGRVNAIIAGREFSPH